MPDICTLCLKTVTYIPVFFYACIRTPVLKTFWIYEPSSGIRCWYQVYYLCCAECISLVNKPIVAVTGIRHGSTSRYRSGNYSFLFIYLRDIPFHFQKPFITSILNTRGRKHLSNIQMTTPSSRRQMSVDGFIPIQPHA